METGMDLKVRRIRRRVTTSQLAERAGWKARSRVSQIESQAVVSPDALSRYLRALATFPDVVTFVEEPIQVMPRTLIDEPADAA